MILTIQIDCESKGEAYMIVSELGFEHKVVSADFDGVSETFDENNKPNQFLKNNENLI